MSQGEKPLIKRLCIPCDSNRFISIGFGAARRLGDLLTAPLPSGPVGEAWIFSDRDDHPSRVADGRLKGRTIEQLLVEFPHQLLGKLAGRFRRFPLLLKFLDAYEMLSVQVHPSDANKSLLPRGETGKTEAWVVVETSSESRIYAGLRPGQSPGSRGTFNPAVARGPDGELYLFPRLVAQGNYSLPGGKFDLVVYLRPRLRQCDRASFISSIRVSQAADVYIGYLSNS